MHALHALFEEEYHFIVGQLVPHMEAIEATLYDRLERVMGGRHSMAPMREEHEEMRRLVDELGGYRAPRRRAARGAASRDGLRRALYRLHALLKVHLAEEELYLGRARPEPHRRGEDVLARASTTPCAEPL